MEDQDPLVRLRSSTQQNCVSKNPSVGGGKRIVDRKMAKLLCRFSSSIHSFARSRYCGEDPMPHQDLAKIVHTLAPAPCITDASLISGYLPCTCKRTRLSQWTQLNPRRACSRRPSSSRPVKYPLRLFKPLLFASSIISLHLAFSTLILPALSPQCTPHHIRDI